MIFTTCRLKTIKKIFLIALPLSMLLANGGKTSDHMTDDFRFKINKICACIRADKEVPLVLIDETLKTANTLYAKNHVHPLADTNLEDTLEDYLKGFRWSLIGEKEKKNVEKFITDFQQKSKDFDVQMTLTLIEFIYDNLDLII